jgi:cytochrome c oxidase assembly factor CtaG
LFEGKGGSIMKHLVIGWSLLIVAFVFCWHRLRQQMHRVERFLEDREKQGGD